VRVLLDECLPRRFAGALTGHIVSTVPDAGLGGLKNGVLLRAIGGRFEAFVTVDKSLPAQHRLSGLAFSIIVIRAPTNRLADLLPLAPKVLEALAGVGPGEIAVVS